MTSSPTLKSQTLSRQVIRQELEDRRPSLREAGRAQILGATSVDEVLRVT